MGMMAKYVWDIINFVYVFPIYRMWGEHNLDVAVVNGVDTEYSCFTNLFIGSITLRENEKKGIISERVC